MFRNFVKVPLRNVRYLHDRKLPSVVLASDISVKSNNVNNSKNTIKTITDVQCKENYNEYKEMENFGTSVGFNLEKYN